MDLISVIVPVYKVEKYLNRCIDSILAQTYTNLEIILVDDGSPDGCPAICDEYALKDNRIKVIHQKNGGVSSARNAGLDIATGDFISFVDSDDFVEPFLFKKLVDALDDNIDIVSSMANCISNDETIISDYLEDVTTICIDNNFTFEDENRYRVVWGKIFRRTVIDKLAFDTTIFLAEDILFNMQAILNSRNIRFIPDALYNYVIYDSSLCHGSLTEKKLTSLKSCEKMFNLFLDFPFSQKNISKLYFGCCFAFYKSSVLDCDESKIIGDKIVEIIKSDVSSEIFEKADLSFKSKLKLFLVKYFRFLYNILLKIFR